MTRSGGFSLVEAVVLLVFAVLLIVLVVAISGSRTSTGCGRRMDANLQYIYKGLVMYAQGNNGFYPGLDSDGNDMDTSVAGRLLVLLSDPNYPYLPTKYLISHVEAESKIPWKPDIPLTADNYSYALLQLTAKGKRRSEWSDTGSSIAPVGSDRAITNEAGDLYSIHGPIGSDEIHWRGRVVWNDGHSTFEETSVVSTRYGTDDLFKADGDDDAYMIYEGK